tara:strand:+ start:1480 stop:3969 length:2490 start_codon:yes stop_codon:yes gene_type:complete
MVRQYLVKDNLDKNIKMDTKNNMKEMNVEDFFKTIEAKNNLTIYRHINVVLNTNGNKIPFGEKNNLSVEDIKTNRGNTNHNTLSLSVKHIPNLYVIDYDTKEADECEFYCKLNEECVAMTETKKGFHFYVYLKNMGNGFSNQQKVNIDSSIEMDLIKTNNIWETKDRTVNGTIKEYDWNNIKQYFDVKKMNFKDSPPCSPPASPKKNLDLVEVVEVFKPIKKDYNASELQQILVVLSREECYVYDTWLKIGMAIHNVTEADSVGFAMFVEWSKQDKENFDLSFIKKNWKYWMVKTTKVGMNTLRKLRDLYTPTCQSSLQAIFVKVAQDGKYVQRAREAVMKEMNNRLIYCESTSNFIKPSKNTTIDYDYEGLETDRREVDGFYVKLLKDIKVDFMKEIFTYIYEDQEGQKQEMMIDPLKMWLHWVERKEVEKIEFDPRSRENNSIFNLWRGYEITKEMAEQHSKDDAQPILDHIKEIWCNGVDEDYQYVMSYLSHIIQKPWIKTGVCLSLKSKQGGGKGVVLKLLEAIIGDAHYSQNSNAGHIFGDFNGLLEAKILCNLDEAFWGGDKKLEGQIKNAITESKQSINKKNVNHYSILDFCNYIITTNNDWFAGIEEGDRRYFCLELINKWAGRANAENEAYYKTILEVRPEAFANVLYNWDLTDFNPRKFKKTPLGQEQVERNWNSVKVWWNMVMKDGGFMFKGDFIEWNKIFVKHNGLADSYKFGTQIKNKNKEKMVAYKKDWLFEVYDSFSSDSRKMSNAAFFRELQKNIMIETYKETRIQKNDTRRMYVLLPELDVARSKWNEVQEYDYTYGLDDDEFCMDNSSDED